MQTSIKAAEARIRRARIPDARAEAEFLVAGLLGLGRGELRLSARTLDGRTASRIRKAVDRRVGREPLAYILGNQPFFDLDLQVRRGVFIPRPETEQLVEVVIGSKRAGRILDLCTGSGAIAIALAKKFPSATVVAVEKKSPTLRVARANARSNGAAVTFLLGDLFSPLRGSEGFDIIVSNPPYVPSARIPRLAPEVRREPVTALDGGKDGLDVIRRIVARAPDHLKAGGRLVMEMDPAQTRPVAKLMRENGFSEVTIVKDFQGRSRIVSGRHG